jgi:hypothetical protein
VTGCCECGDEPSGSCATELVSLDECSHLASVIGYLTNIFLANVTVSTNPEKAH